MIATIRAVKVLAAIFFMRKPGYFVMKIYQTSLAQQFSALEKYKILPYFGSYFIVT
ncbi:hypothetical protein [Microcoleus sp. BROC3]|uniref:hypothetical protein n=1 Tax=Microcoleus sp. BROC3 TaxID=3055323 RepID=UPI002FD20A75